MVQSQVKNHNAETSFIPCSIHLLPDELLGAAAANAINIDPRNAPAQLHYQQAFADVRTNNKHLAVFTTKYWGSKGMKLTVGFPDNPPADLRVRILFHMNAWSTYANVSFVETKKDPQVRITRDDSGYWSNLGTDILLVAKEDATMNLQGFTMQTSDAEFHRVVRHETGHTLGFPHEHLRKEIVDRIDSVKAIDYFAGSPNFWSKEETIYNVLTPLDQSILNATLKPDIHSIMCYGLPGSIMKDGRALRGGADIDQEDGRFAGLIYPKN